jgi:hypothetical protein
MATPHTAAVATLLLEKDPTLKQARSSRRPKSTALTLTGSGVRAIFDFDYAANISSDSDCYGTPCDALGAGVLQADQALNAPQNAPQNAHWTSLCRLSSLSIFQNRSLPLLPVCRQRAWC